MRDDSTLGMAVRSVGTSPAPVPLVQQQLNALDESMAILWKLVDSLGDRLTSVLAPPANKGAECSNPATVGTICGPVANQLQVLNRKAESIRDRVNDIAVRLEV